MISSPILLALMMGTTLVGHIEAANMRSKYITTTDSVRAEDVRATMLNEVMDALGEGHRVTEDRLSSIEEALRPMFATMPKNEQGHLDHAAVSYLLHRLFVQRHGMFLKGVEPSNNWNASSPTAIFADKVSTYVQNMFEERLRGHGLGLHELAILAATLEHIIHDQTQERLKLSYTSHNFSMDRLLTEKEAQNVIDTSLAIFILGAKSPKDVAGIHKIVSRSYPGWEDTLKFARDVNANVTAARKDDEAFAPGKVAFAATSMVVEEIGERFGRWQNRECQDLKGALLKIEDGNSGRVLLKDFYGHALDGAWQFTESVDYLRELGALDETNPNRKSVIIANYVNAPSNCIASSGIYSLCCINECEDLMGQVEREVAEPETTTATILQTVSKMSSSTVTGPRELSGELHSRLGEIAEHHEGLVPLHGRLFAQWMHHAFPRECPFPHKSGTTNPMTPDEWMKSQNSSEAVTEQDMHFHARQDLSNVTESDVETKLAWTMEEELVVTRPKVRARSGFMNFLLCLAFGSVFLAMLSSMGSTLGSTITETLGGGKNSKFRSRQQPLLPFAGKEHNF